MNVKPCATYFGDLTHRIAISMPDGLSVFKTYYVSIPGRDDRERYEWACSPLSVEEGGQMLRDSGIEGVGFITSFPHITKVFRFAPAAETVLHVRAFHTRDLQPMSLDRDDGFTEFACLAEALIAADEYQAWAAATDVGAYLEQWSKWENGGIRDSAKLAAYAAKH